ncbi:MAG: response regulator [Thermodesulfobacteriota bacterium]|jgi:HD-like signal output (HDOD) protein
MKKRILFVDDDPQLLKSIRRMLWDKQDRWELSFLASGEEALAAFAAQPFDVLVADMRMPGMEGHQLLARTRALYPWTMRVVLSGVSERQYIMRAVPLAHQFLTKPVPAERLAEVIERGCALRDMILSDELRTLISGIDALPAQPDVYARLVKALDDESAPVEAIASVISRDVALSADVLKLVNSSFFGPRMHVSRLEKAVTLLGVDTIRGIVLGLQMLKVFDTRKFPDFSFPKLWEHCLNTALLAKAIAAAEDLPPDEQDDSFIAGMLHDLGKFVLADKIQHAYREAVSASRDSNTTIVEAEQKILGACHAQAGAYLLGLWGLPDRVLEAVAFHHAPSSLTSPAMNATAAVHAANALEHELVVINRGYAPHNMDTDYLERIGMAGRLDGWRQLCRETLETGGSR